MNYVIYSYLLDALWLRIFLLKEIENDKLNFLLLFKLFN